MAGTAAKAMAATVLFGAIHSALASRAAKRAAARLLGPPRRNALYRPFYLVQAAATLGLLAAYIRRLPGRTLYHVHGRPAWALRAGQAAGLVHALWAARQVGIGRMLGVDGLAAWVRDEPVPPEPEAQGPAPDAEGRLRATGPFRWSRHPLNLSPLPVFWLFPRMTDRLAAFNLAATIYLVLGSVHEEARLRDAYGPAYEAYRRGGVPFYLPRPGAVRRVSGTIETPRTPPPGGRAAAPSGRPAARH